MNNIYEFPKTSHELMLLSYRKLATASSSKTGHGPSNAVDGNECTFWSSKTSDVGEWLCVDLAAAKNVFAVKLDSSTCENNPSILGSIDNDKFELLFDGKKERIPKSKTIVFDHGLRLRFIKLVFNSPSNECFEINSLNVLGFGNGNPPKKVETPFSVKSTENSATICWNKVSTAIGYRIRFGFDAENLEFSKTVYGDDCANIEWLSETTNQCYYAVDSFNENGVTAGDVKPILLTTSKNHKI